MIVGRKTRLGVFFKTLALLAMVSPPATAGELEAAAVSSADAACVQAAVVSSEYVVQAELVSTPAVSPPMVVKIMRVLGHPSPQAGSKHPLCNQYLLLTELPDSPELSPVVSAENLSQQFIIAYSGLTRAGADTDYVQARVHGFFPLSAQESISSALAHAFELNVVKSAQVLAFVQHGTGRCIRRRPLGSNAFDLEYLIECTVLEPVRGCEAGQKIYYIFNAADARSTADEVGTVRDFSKLGMRFIGSHRKEEISRNRAGDPILKYNRVDHISEATIREVLGQLGS